VSKPKTSTRSFVASASPPARYELQLFIAGTTPLSAAALTNVVSLCEERLSGQYDLVVVDIYQEPARAKAAQVVAVPTLLKTSPRPVRRLIGDLSDRTQVLSGLGLPGVAHQAHEKGE
jgi:circadian clock protein KaiB